MSGGNRGFHLIDFVAKTGPNAYGQDRAGETAKEKDQPLL